jgi:hypothetical protein
MMDVIIHEIPVLAGSDGFRKARTTDPDGLDNTPIAVVQTEVEGLCM